VFMTDGRVFCAGADLTGDAGGALEPGPVNPLYVQVIRLAEARKPWVAAVQGAAVGAGLGLALSADFRIAGPAARFSANFVKLGFHPGFGISHLLARTIGEQRATLMQLTGRRVRAEEALAWGLVDDLVPEDELRAAAARLAAELAEGAPLAVESTRATLRAGLVAALKAATDREHAEQTRLRDTADFAEGVRAVAERRPGRFVGA
jgi:enoyl-CoA hydratase/carnithine racemase